MTRVVNRPFFSFGMLVIAALVVAGALLVSQALVAAFHRLIF